MVVVPQRALALAVVTASVFVRPVVVFELPRTEPIAWPAVRLGGVVPVVHVGDDVGTTETLHDVGQAVVDAAENRLSITAHKSDARHRALVRSRHARC